MKLKPKIGVAFTCIDGFDLNQDKLGVYKDKVTGILNDIDMENKFIKFIVKSEDDARKANGIFLKENLDAILLIVAVWTPDSTAITLINNLDIPVIIFTTSLSTQTVSINGAQVVAAAFKELGIDFKFIFGDINDKSVQKKIINYSFASAIVKKLKKIRIGFIGFIPEIMLSLNINIFSVKKVFGPIVVPVDYYKLEEYFKKVNDREINNRAQEIKNLVGKVGVANGVLKESIRYYFALKNMAKDLNLDALAVNCFPFPQIKGKTCLAISNLNDDGINTACEGDVNSLIIMVVFNFITGKASLNSDLIIEYKNENKIMFSHCGCGPFTYAASTKDVILEEQYEVKSGMGVYYPVKIGGRETTVVNLVGTEATYRMCILNGRTVPTEKLTYYGNPINIKFKTPVKELINIIGNEGFGHHWMVTYGNHKDILLEICKLLKIKSITIN